MKFTNPTSPRLFDHPILEALSRVRPWMPIVIWGPVALGLLHHGWATGTSVKTNVALFLAGLLVWTATEYGLHRFLFHWRPTNSYARRLVYLMHGIHHEFPNDADRLLMPPAAALGFAVFFGIVFFSVLGAAHFPIFFGAFLLGYLIYDYSHFAAHYSQSYGQLFPGQKRRHMVHHFVDPNRSFGVSSPIWDRIFRT